MTKNKRKGVSNSRNLGIELSKGKYIYFLDFDDMIKSNSLEILVDIAERNNYKIVYGGYERKKELVLSGDKACDYTVYDISYDSLNSLLYSGTIWGGIIDSEIIKKNNIKFDESLQYGEDTIFKFNILRYIDKLVVTYEKLYYWRIVSGSLSYKASDYDLLQKELKMVKSMYSNIDKYKNKNYISIVIKFIRVKKNSMYRIIFDSEKDIQNYKILDSIRIPFKYILKSNMKYKDKLIESLYSLLYFMDRYYIWKVLFRVKIFINNAI
nr:glycosyltransferase [Romboutsia sp. Marseille-P6047]